MPASYTLFTLPTRKLRAKVEVDTDRNGTFEDYTSSLDHFTILSSIKNGLFGLFDSVCEFELMIADPSINWIKSGLPVRVTVSVSDDNFTTQHDEYLFFGTTSAQNTVPTNTIKVRATSYLSNFLDKTITNKAYVNVDINEIIEDLLLLCGVNPANISITPTGRTVIYFVGGKSVRHYISDLLTATLSVGGFDRDNVFRIRSVMPLVANGGTYTPISTFAKNTIIDYKSRNLITPYYYNEVKIEGVNKIYLSNDILIYNNQIQGAKIEAGKVFFYEVEEEGVEITRFYPFVPLNPQSINSIQAIGSLNSYFTIRTLDDGSGVDDNTSVNLVSASLINKNGKDILLLKFENTSIFDRYLTGLYVYGNGVKTLENLSETQRDDVKILEDGEVRTITVNSQAIQDEVSVLDLATQVALNTSITADVYSIDTRAQPRTQIGEIISITDRNNVAFPAIVIETDTEFSQDNGYSQSVVAKRLYTEYEYMVWDIDPWDDLPML